MVELDGSRGEGGGQILRSALTLSMLTGQPFKLINVRANRNPPGLRPQHLASVRAAAGICHGLYKGGSVGSSVLYFEPKTVKAGKYRFDIGTAGSTGLVLQTIFLPLALRAAAASEITITGGTHIKTSPCYHYLETTWAGYLRRMGFEIDLKMVRPGFYPRGGGEIVAVIRPCAAVRPLSLTNCPTISTAGGFGAVAGLPNEIAKRLARRMATRLKSKEIESHLPMEEWSGGPGAVAAVVFRQMPVPTLFAAIGERGKPAERVAEDVIEEAFAFHAASAPVDPHAADQLLLPLVFSPQESVFRTSEITRHLTTNVATIGHFLRREITVEGEEGSSGLVRLAACATIP